MGRPWRGGVAAAKPNGELRERTRLLGRPWILGLAAAWMALVAGVFSVRYFRLLDAGYGLTEKLAGEGPWSILARWLGF